MPETRYREMAGTGIIKSGTTFSINPVQKLRIVTVTDRLSVPSDDLQSDSAAPVGYVTNLLSQSGRVVPGTGLIIENGTIRLADTIDVKKISIIDPPEQPNDAVSLAYVSNALSSTISETRLTEVVDGCKANFVDKTSFESVVKELATFANLEEVLREAELTANNVINDTAAVLINEQKHQAVQIRQLISAADVDQLLSNYVPKPELAEALQDLAPLSSVKTMVSQCVTNDSFEQAVKKLATIDYVADSLRDKVAHNEVDNMLSNVASREYVDNSVAGLATVEYVDSQTPKETPKETSNVQYVKPDDGEEILIMEATRFLILDPSANLGTVRLTFPSDAQDGHLLTIATSCDVEDLVLLGLPVSGEVQVPKKVVFTAGSALHFVYVNEGHAWFVV